MRRFGALVARRGGATAIVAPALLLAVAGLAWQAATATRIVVGSGCGYDGLQYCQMAAGQGAIEPFSRRILLPGIVTQLGLSGPDGFALVNAIVLVACLGAFLYLCGVHASNWRHPASAAVVAIGVLTFLGDRNTIHLYLSYPVLTDFLALLFLLVGCGALIKTQGDARWSLIAAGAAFAGALTRENLAVVIMATAVGLAVMGNLRWRTVLPILAAGTAGTLIAFAQPSLTSAPQPLVDVITGWIAADLGSLDGLLRFVVMVALGLGPFVGACVAWRRPIWRDGPCRIMAVMAIIYAGVSIFDGGDTDRILMPAGILLAACTLRLHSLGVVRLRPLLLFVGAWWIWQLPFVVVGGDSASWIGFWALRVAPVSDVLTFGLAPILVGLLLLAVITWLAPSERRSGTSIGLSPA